MYVHKMTNVIYVQGSELAGKVGKTYESIEFPVQTCHLQIKASLKQALIQGIMLVPDVALLLDISLLTSVSPDVYGGGMYGPVSGNVLFLPSTVNKQEMLGGQVVNWLEH